MDLQAPAFSSFLSQIIQGPPPKKRFSTHDIKTRLWQTTEVKVKKHYNNPQCTQVSSQRLGNAQMTRRKTEKARFLFHPIPSQSSERPCQLEGSSATNTNTEESCPNSCSCLGKHTSVEEEEKEEGKVGDQGPSPNSPDWLTGYSPGFILWPKFSQASSSLRASDRGVEFHFQYEMSRAKKYRFLLSTVNSCSIADPCQSRNYESLPHPPRLSPAESWTNEEGLMRHNCLLFERSWVLY